MTYTELQRDLTEVARALAAAFDFGPLPRSPDLPIVQTWRPNDWWPAPRAGVVDNHLRPYHLSGKGLSLWDLGCDLALVLDTGHGRLRLVVNEMATTTELFEPPCRHDLDHLAEANGFCEGRLVVLFSQGGEQALAALLSGSTA